MCAPARSRPPPAGNVAVVHADRCDVCRFDAAAYTLDDARGSARNAADRWRWTVEHLAATTAEGRDRSCGLVAGLAASASALADRLAAFDDEIGQQILVASAARHGRRDGVVADDDPAGSTMPEALARLATTGARLDHTIIEARRADVDAIGPARRAAHDVEHELRMLGRAVAGLASPTAAAREGVVAAIFVSRGGVPKHPIPSAQIGYRGVAGDRQRARQHHGRVWQALCLWSQEVIDALQAEGHPIHPGAAGENIVVRGLDWQSIRPGVRLGLGPTVIAEVTAFAEPCTKNAQWFRDRRFQRIDHDRHPGWSRVYAAVLRDGDVREGDGVTVEP